MAGRGPGRSADASQWPLTGLRRTVPAAVPSGRRTVYRPSSRPARVWSRYQPGCPSGTCPARAAARRSCRAELPGVGGQRGEGLAARGPRAAGDSVGAGAGFPPGWAGPGRGGGAGGGAVRGVQHGAGALCGYRDRPALPARSQPCVPPRCRRLVPVLVAAAIRGDLVLCPPGRRPLLLPRLGLRRRGRAVSAASGRW